MNEHDPKNKAMQQPDSNAVSRPRGELKCIRECEVPGTGLYHVGDTVTGHEAYEKLKDHPYFTIETEAK